MIFVAQTVDGTVYAGSEVDGGNEYKGGIEISKLSPEDTDGEFAEIRIEIQGVGFGNISLEEAKQLGELLTRLSIQESTNIL